MVLVAITLFGFMEVQDKRGAVKENLNRIWRISTMIDIKCTPPIINKILSIIADYELSLILNNVF